MTGVYYCLIRNLQEKRNHLFGKDTFQKECTFIKMHKREQFIILKWSYVKEILRSLHYINVHNMKNVLKSLIRIMCTIESLIKKAQCKMEQLF